MSKKKLSHLSTCSKDIIDYWFRYCYTAICERIGETQYFFTDVHYVGYYLDKRTGIIKFDVTFNKYDMYTGEFLGVGRILFKECLYD